MYGGNILDPSDLRQLRSRMLMSLGSFTRSSTFWVLVSILAEIEPFFAAKPKGVDLQSDQLIRVLSTGFAMPGGGSGSCFQGQPKNSTGKNRNVCYPGSIGKLHFSHWQPTPIKPNVFYFGLGLMKLLYRGRQQRRHLGDRFK